MSLALNTFAEYANMQTDKLLESLSVFVDTVRAGGFSAVARQRGLVASSIARQIDALEADLQVALFMRSTRSLKPTKAGELLFHRAVRILDELADTRSEIAIFDREVQGLLQISCLPTFGRRYVLPCLSKLLEKHLGLRVELDLTEKLTNPNIERQDAAIRFGEQPDSKLIGMRISMQRYVVCAAPAYLHRYGVPATLQDFHGHRLIDKRHRASALGWREIMGRHRLEQTAYVFECDDFEALRIAAIAGSGIARLPDWVVGPDVREGVLRELSVDGIPSEPTGIYLLRALPKPSAKLIAFAECLQEVIGSPPVWEC